MPKTIAIDTEPWCPDDCGYFELADEAIYGDNRFLEKFYFCSNHALCRNAVEAYKKYKEEN